MVGDIFLGGVLLLVLVFGLGFRLGSCSCSCFCSSSSFRPHPSLYCTLLELHIAYQNHSIQYHFSPPTSHFETQYSKLNIQSFFSIKVVSNTNIRYPSVPLHSPPFILHPFANPTM